MRVRSPRYFLELGSPLIAGCFLLQGIPAFAQESSIPLQPVAPQATVEQGDGPAGSIWVGGDVAPGSYGVGAGATVALSGNLYEDGVLLRANAGFGDYESGVSSRVSFTTGSLLVGYQAHLGDVYVAAYAGPQVLDNGSGADPDVVGTSWDGLFTGEIVVPAGAMELSSWGSYSTFENQYYVQGRAAYFATPTFKLGPQLALLGGDTWKQGRAGGYAGIGLPFGGLEAGVGYTWDRDGTSNEGIYATAGVSFAF